MIAPQCSTVCGSAAQAVQAAAEADCCPKTCATTFTAEDTLNVVPEFTRTVPDEHYVYLTIRGTAVKIDGNFNGASLSYVFTRAVARRWDADNVNPGLHVMNVDNTNSLFSGGTNVLVQASGNDLQVVLDSAAGNWRWELEMEYCLVSQIVDEVTGAG